MALPEVVVALATPFGNEGKVDHGALAAHVEWCLACGVDGIMPCGTTGEGPLLDDGEVSEVVATVAAAVSARGTVIAHVGRIGTAATIRLAREATEIGATRIAAVVPYYYKLSGSQVFKHFEMLVGAVPEADVYAYCIPGNTGTDLSDGNFEKLLACGLTGVKDSTKSLERHRAFLTATDRVYMGSDELVAAAFDAGAAGCISAVANCRPDLLLDLRESPRAGRDAELLRVRDELYRAGDKIVELKKRIAAVVPGYPTTVRAPLGTC